MFNRPPLSQPTRAVLYVEDHPVNAMLMAALFEARPQLKLVVAQNGQQALLIAAGLDPALLLLDMRLPDCHGTQLLPLLRQLPGCESAPAVAVTAEEDFVLEGSGFVELWRKPLDLAWVMRRLDALTASLDETADSPAPTARGLETAAAAAARLAPGAWRTASRATDARWR